MKKTDSYTDQVGWSTDVGRTLGEKPKPKEPETIRHQCTLCGAIMKVPKPKKAVTQYHAHTVDTKIRSIDHIHKPNNSRICLIAAISITDTNVFLTVF